MATTPLLAVGLILAFALVVEVVARTGFVRARVIPPSVGSRFRLLDQHLAQMDDLVRDGVAFDCVVLGNSLPLVGIDPEVLDTAFRERSDRGLECYTLAVPGMLATDAAALARVIFEDYRAWLVIYATAAREFALKTSSPGLAGLPWLRYRTGHISFEGWLVDHSQAYRYYLLYRSWSVPEQRRFVEYRFETSGRGVIKLRRGSKPLPATLEDAVPKLKAPLIKLLSRGGSNNLFESLGELADLHGSKGQIVVLEMPAMPVLLESLPEDAPNYERIIRRMQGETERSGLPFWRPPPAGVIPDDGWIDLWHMSPPGAAAYSRWLAHRIADAIASGELAAPSP